MIIIQKECSTLLVENKKRLNKRERSYSYLTRTAKECREFRETVAFSHHCDCQLKRGEALSIELMKVTVLAEISWCFSIFLIFFSQDTLHES